MHATVHYLKPDGSVYPEAECPMQQVLKNKKRIEGVEEVLIKKDKTFFPVRVAATPVLEDDSIVGIVYEFSDLTREKQASQSLAESERRFEAVVNDASWMILVWNQNAQSVFISQPWLAYTGVSLDHTMKVGWHEKIHPDDRQSVIEEWRNAFVHQERFAREYRIRRYDGQYRWFYVSSTPRFAPDGKFIGFYATAIDIHDKKQAELKLTETEARFRRLYDANMVGVIFWNMSGLITDANDAFLEMVGHTRDDLEHGRLDWRRMTPPEYTYLDRDAVTQLQAQAVSKPYEKQYFHRDGHRIDVLLSSTFLEGSSYDGVAFVLDISERKEAELALIKSEAKFRRLYESNLLAVMFWKPDGSITEANDAFLKMVGYTREDLENGRINWREMTPPEYEPLDNIALEELVVHSQSKIWEKQYFHKDGHRVDILIFDAMLEESRSEGVCFILDITQRKQAELALQKSEQYFRQIADASSILLWMVDENANLLFVSQGLAEFFGKPKDELMGLQWQDVIHPDYKDAFVKVIFNHIAQQEPFSTEAQMLWADGEPRWMLSNGQPRYDYAGKFIGFIGTLVDITDRKKAEAAERQSEAYFREILEASPVNLWLGDNKGALTFANNVLLDYLQIQAEDILGDRWMEKVHPEDRRRFAVNFAKHFQKHEAYTLEFRFTPHNDEHYLWFLSTARPRYLPSGEFVGYVGTIVDITARKETELELRKSEEYFRQIVDYSPIMLWMSDPHGQIRFVSKGLSAYFGLEKEDFLGEQWFSVFYPGGPEAFYNLFDPQTEAYNAEVQVVNKNGRHRWVLNSGHRRYGLRGEFLGFVGTITDITASKEARLAIERSEEYFREIVDKSPVMLWIADSRGRNEYVSEGLATYFGLQKEDFKGEKWLDAFHPDDRTMLQKVYKEAVRLIQPYHIEVRARAKSGNYRWVLDSGKPRFGAQGEFIGFIGALVDVHDRKEAMLAIERSEEYFREIADKSPVMLWISDPNADVTFVSQGYADYFGRQKQDFMGDDWLNVIHPEDRENFERFYKDHVRQEDTYTAEYRVFDKAGRMRWILDFGQPRYDSEGGYTGFIGTLTDITDRKESMLALEQSEEYFRHIVDASPVMLWIDNAEGVLTFVSKGLTDYFHCEKEELLGEQWLNSLHPEDRDAHYQLYQEYEKRRECYTSEYRVFDKEGRIRWLLDFGQPRFDPQGQFMGYVGTITDITKQKEAMLALERSEEYFRYIVNEAPVMLWMSDPEGKVTFHSKKTLEYFGYAEEELLGDQWLTALHPEDRERFYQFYMDHVRRKEAYTKEFRVDRHGEYRWVMAFGQPRFDLNDQFIGFIGTVTDITEQKEAELVIRESEAQLRTIIDAAPVKVWMSDPQGEYIYISKGLLDFLGVADVKEAKLATLPRLIHPEDLDSFLQLKMQQIQKQEPYESEVRILNGQGQCRWILTMAQPRFDEGRFVGHIGSVVDITEKKEAEIAIRESEAYFRMIVDAAPVLLWMADPDGIPLYASQNLIEFLGTDMVQRVRKLGKDGWQILFHPDDLKGFAEYRKEQLEKREPYQHEARIRNKEDEYRWVMLAAHPRFATTGEFLGYIGSMVDITQRKQSELSLQESETRFRSMADAAPVMIWITDATGKVTYFNKMLLEFLGLTLEQAVSEEYMKRVHPSHLEELLALREKLHRNPQPARIETLLYSPSLKEYRWTYSTMLPRYSPEGAFEGYIGSSLDITDFKRAQEEINQYARRLEQSNRDLEQFAMIASHDLQAPIRKIAMFSGYIQETSYDALSPESRDYFDRILKSVDKMQRLLNDLLDLSRINRKGQPFQEVCLNDILNDVIADLEFSILDTQGRIEVGDLCTVDADPLQMHQLFQNLLSNALKFHRPNVPPVVRITVKTITKTECRLIVEDNGIGFEPDQTERIFEPFIHLNAAEQYEGTGMGLTICRKIVERHGGKISASSKPGKGTQFNISLPLQHLQSRRNQPYR